MAQADGKLLALGALAGVASVGIGMAVVYYRGQRPGRRATRPSYHLIRTNNQECGLTVVDGPGESTSQAEVLDRLEELLQCVSELKDEMKALKNALPMLQDRVREELRASDEARRMTVHYRTTPTRKKRSSATFRGETHSSEEAESEGGYLTALTDSDEDGKSTDEEREDEDAYAYRLSVLLERIDRFHRGSELEKKESLSVLLEQKAEFGQNSPFLWRLIRAHCDVHDVSSTLEEKKTHAERGKRVGEEAVALNPTCAESHQWYAIMCGIMAEYESVQNKIKNGYLFKDLLDKAIELKPGDPLSYYLLGRWCYAVAQLSWIERKIAATLFGEPPTATVEDALRNFLKVEEIHPAYSKLNYVFLAKCYKDLGQMEKARKMCGTACSMKSDTKKVENAEAEKELEMLCPALGM